jgi:hypothetical protein
VLPFFFGGKPMIPLSITTRTLAIFAVLAFLLLCATLPADAAGRDPFAEGSMRVSVIVGNGYTFDQSYLVVGVGFGYFVATGLELGLDAESWSSGTPGITKISPALRYVVPTNSTIRPYIGAFYRWTMIENHDNLNSVGGRAGIYLLSGQGSYFGAGIVYEKYLSCDEAVYSTCSSTYSEIIFAIAF